MSASVAEVSGEARDLLEVRPLSVLGEVANLHVLGHYLQSLTMGIGLRAWQRNR